MLADEGRDRHRFGFAQLELAGIKRELRIAVGEVAVEVDAFSRIFADARIAVRVAPLDRQDVRGALALLAVRRAHDARIDAVDEMRGRLARGRDHPHAGDRAVAVEIGGRVFVRRGVAIVVDHACIRRPREPRRERDGARIGVCERDRVDPHLLEERRVVADDRGDRLRHARWRRELRCIHAADKEERRPSLAHVLVAQDEDIDRPLLDRVADGARRGADAVWLHERIEPRKQFIARHEACGREACGRCGGGRRRIIRSCDRAEGGERACADHGGEGPLGSMCHGAEDTARGRWATARGRASRPSSCRGRPASCR